MINLTYQSIEIYNQLLSGLKETSELALTKGLYF